MVGHLLRELSGEHAGIAVGGDHAHAPGGLVEGGLTGRVKNCVKRVT